MRERSLDELTFSLFAGLLHTTFRVDLAPGQTVDVELTQASLAAAGPGLTTRPSPGAVSYERFSLIFRGAQGDPLGQGIHRFEHPQVGRFRMFIVPIRLRHSGYASYEAVFTRARPCSSAPV